MGKGPGKTRESFNWMLKNSQINMFFFSMVCRTKQKEWALPINLAVTFLFCIVFWFKQTQRIFVSKNVFSFCILLVSHWGSACLFAMLSREKLIFFCCRELLDEGKEINLPPSTFANVSENAWRSQLHWEKWYLWITGNSKQERIGSLDNFTTGQPPLITHNTGHSELEATEIIVYYFYYQTLEAEGASLLLSSCPPTPWNFPSPSLPLFSLLYL